MKKVIFIFVLSLVAFHTSAQSEIPAFKKGEWLKFRISYSNFLNAGNATLQIKNARHKGQEAYHVVGKGKTTGVISWFFKVRDDYQSYFYKDNILPYHFIRKIDEGGYKKNKEIFFDQPNQKALVKNHKYKTEKYFSTKKGVQDMVSTLYYMRNKDLSRLNVGDEIALTMFFDEENYNFRLRFLCKETIKTKFGKVASLKFRPMVQAGRVFKESESLTVWVSADKNKIPLRVKASLAVGSLRADLDGFKGLANSFPIIF